MKKMMKKMKKLAALVLAATLVMSLCGAALADGSGARGFTLTPITWDGAGLGKVAVPDGYEMSSEVHCSDETTCLGSPLRVTVALASAEEYTNLYFKASETYFERVYTNYPGILKDVNGRDSQTMIFTMPYMDAAGYCDALVESVYSSYPVTFYKDEDSSAFDAAIESYKDSYVEMNSGLAQYGITLNWIDATAAQRVYTFETDGVTWAVCVLAAVRGLEMNAAGEVTRTWDVPSYYMMSCPLEDYEQQRDEVFMPFVENTAVSDTFTQLQDDLTYQIRDQTINEWNMQVAASNAYAAAMSALTTASVESYLQSSSYSSSDRFTDYIFDRNTYTTSDGYDVSVSTSYDYVWEGNGGTVYYSDSAFDVPSGAILLDPN